MKMNINGIGCDILEIKRFEDILSRKGNAFLDKIFTQNEIEYSKKYKDYIPHLAARFAAKEAIAKALGIGFGKNLSFLDIEVINNSEGKPEVFLSDKIKNSFNNPSIHLSISHSKDSAIAFAICEK
ncbi:MAG: Holo-[acyl-carrier-protein] synthase [Candidatus Anoxychlamydiales bacterium]|nr:Holo-[acyl-carrier-protein] synthase [Candidatus Anoxychlamydiales bacterium]